MTQLRKTQVAHHADAAPFAIRAERASDVVAREALLDACFGENRHTRTCQRLRDGHTPAEGFAFSALAQGRLVGTLRLWHVSAGGTRALVLGPLAVDPSCRNLGVGAALIKHALIAAEVRGHRAVILLGDAPITAASAFRRGRPANCRCPARSNAIACSALSYPRARSTAPGGWWCRPAPRCRKSRHRVPRRSAPCRAPPDASIMSKSLPTTRDAAPSRLRRAVTTVLMIMLAVMIVRDIFARRWGSTTEARQDIGQQDVTHDVTQRSP
jgi:predicted N-acetyltransferase YhbS